MATHKVFARVAAGRRIWVVAAIHGDFRRLQDLHRTLSGKVSPKDSLVYLGNILGYGSDVIGTVDEILKFRRWFMAQDPEDHNGRIVYLRGAQEEMWHKLLQMHLAPSPRQLLEWMLSKGVGATIEAYGGSIRDARVAANGGPVPLSRWTNELRGTLRKRDGHQQLLSALKRAAYTEDQALLLVHAGLDPSRPLPYQKDGFWWNAESFERIDRPYEGFRRIVRGFDPQHRGVEVTPLTTSIDGGCGFGGPLIAACIEPTGDLCEVVEV